MITAADILRDRDVAVLAGMSLYSFRRRMTTGFKTGEIDFTRADPMTNGGRRVWLRSDVERVIRDRVTVRS